MSGTGDATPQAPPDESPVRPPVDPGHPFEPDRVPGRAALWAVAGLLSGVAVSALLVWGLFQYFAAGHRPTAPLSLETQRLEPPSPRLETTLLGDSPLIRARAALETERYRWRDAAHSRAQVPVSRAMEIVAARGWPEDAPR